MNSKYLYHCFSYHTRIRDMTAHNQGWPVAFTGGICHRYLPVNTGMDNTPKSGVYRHLLAFINISLISLQIILLTVLATHYIIHGHHSTIFTAYAYWMLVDI